MTAKREPHWLPYVDLACVSLAGLGWYAQRPTWPWPVAVALLPWLFRLVWTGRLGRRTPFDAPLLLFVLTAGVSVWAAYDRPAAWYKLGLISGGILFFYALVHAEAIGDRRIWLLGFFAAGTALFFLLTHDWETAPAKIPLLTRLGQTIQSPLPMHIAHSPHLNIVANVLVILLPFVGLLVVRSWQGARQERLASVLRRWFPLALSLGFLALTLFGLLMTTSRAAWLALASMAVLVALWSLAGRLGRGRAGGRRWAFGGLLALTLGLGLVAFSLWPEGLAAIVEALPGPNSLSSRATLLRSALILVRDYALIGAGLDNFPMLYSTYALLIHVPFTTHSHNLFVNLAVEQGLPAVLILIWMWLLFAGAVWRGVLGGEPRPGRGALAAAALSLTAMGVHGLADNTLYGSHGLFLLFMPLAFAVPFLGGRAAPRRRWAALYRPLGIAALLVLALLWRRPLLSLIYSNLGAVHQSQAELGVYAWPQWPVQDAVRREVDLGRPVAEFERALAFNPRNATANRRLGMIELARGEYAAALDHLAAAYAVEPWSATTRQLYGEALIVNGRADEGRALWQDVNDDQGQLRLRAVWYRYIGDEARAKQIEEASGIP